jgi:hypothetical protein
MSADRMTGPQADREAAHDDLSEGTDCIAAARDALAGLAELLPDGEAQARVEDAYSYVLDGLDLLNRADRALEDATRRE